MAPHLAFSTEIKYLSLEGKKKKKKMELNFIEHLLYSKLHLIHATTLQSLLYTASKANNNNITKQTQRIYLTKVL